MKTKILIWIGIVIILAGSIYGYVYWKSLPGQYDDFASCLTENNVKMYGTNWCKYCQKQKEMFGRSFKYVNFINCDYEKQECLANGVKDYPTWIIDNKKYSGVQSLERLSSLTGCEL